jgi:glycosyltransferase involved in cell wall biosynthesis
LRIAIINSIRAYGGGEKWVLRAAHCLSQRGVTVRVLGDPDGELGRRCPSSGIPFAAVRLNRCSLLSGATALGRALRTDLPDAVICCNERAARLAALAAALPGSGVGRLPIIYRNGLEGSFKNKPFNRLLVAPRIARYVVNAEATRAELQRFGWISHQKLRLIYNGVDPAPVDQADPQRLRAELDAGPDEVVVFSAARLVPEKGHALLLDALSRIDVGLRPLLWIAGEGPEQAALMAQVQRLELARWVRLLGFRSDIPRLLRAADLLCHPSRREGAPNIVLEAMVAGLPVVGLAASGTMELVQDGVTGLLSPVEDGEGLARNLEQLVREAPLRERLGKAGRQRALTEFTEARSTDRWMQLLAEVIG